ncbi:MAG: universal stress protein [Pseudomonas sp.]|uniref:universal stress protein n=1 Tax=Pseudomonas sp. TaxID=306 RepID=UPI003BB741E6
MFKHILIAHDLSHQADVALRRAAQLANQHHARLTLLHVVESQQSASELASLRTAAEQVLGRLASFNHCEADVRLEQGKPNEIILKLLSEENVDLLVLGAHHKNQPELFSGTNLDRLARLSTVPVLLAVNEDGQPYRQAVVAIDFSLCACNALQHAYQLLPSSAELLALNIFSTSSRLAKRDAEERLSMQRLLIEQLMADESSRLPKDGPQLKHEVMPGTLSASLDELIAKRQPQLLALGRHNRGVLAQALLGSLAQHYLNKAPCDVLLVR